MELTNALQATVSKEAAVAAKLSDVAGDLAVNVVVAVLILVATFWASRWVSQIVRRAISSLPRARKDATLIDFASSLARYAVVVFGLVAVLRRLGVETTSIITVLGAASLAVGLALQGTLSNVAAGVMILLFRPYRVGDLVTIAGQHGRVRRLDLFNTELRNLDNLKVVVPNGKAFGGDPVINFTDVTRRRIELAFGIGYDEDIGKATEIALRCAAEDPRILKDPAPWCKPTELAASTVNITLRAWTGTEVYVDTRSDLLRRVKEAFDAEGVSLPYPTQTTLEKPVPPEVSPPARDPAPSLSGSASARRA